jgi:hypothetical protein
VQSFDAPPPGAPGESGRGYPSPPREYAAGRPSGYAAGSPGYGPADQQAAYDQQASYDLPGQQAAWQGQAQAQARPAGARRKGFIASLFDFSFTSFVTPTVVKTLYALATIAVFVWALFFVLVGFHFGHATGGLFVLIVIVPISVVLMLGSLRVCLEVFMALHRINENVQEMRDRDSGPGGGGRY